ncbi:DUF6351 family protein [Variovorax paradoxus]|uniref:DUF6351 family protein n=1 Tax=Variovorax paradoxus TaxID=34073 RepID=UPI0012D424F7|nr:DUF6351 family protein [Variovorax paradoxus]
MRIHIQVPKRVPAGLAISAVLIATLAGCGGSGGGFGSIPVSIPVSGETPGTSVSLAAVSTRKDMVSDGDVVVEATPSTAVPTSPITFMLNGTDVTDRLVLDKSTSRMRGLLTGLKVGANVLTAVSAGKEIGKLELNNFSATGPIFSGTRQSPWSCETEASGLGPPPASGPCVAKVRYDWFYRTKAGTFAPLAVLKPPYPADLARTTTTEGKEVDYIVRVESGTVNESIYRIAMLDDPSDPVRAPWSKDGKKPGNGWNGKLNYPFLGGASPGFRSGKNEARDALLDTPLSLGFAVAFGTRNTYGTGEDDVTSSETTMMVKERFVEQYGIPKFTIGTGVSGGSILQHYIVHNYPGLLDAIIPGASFSDIPTLAVDIIDCKPLNNYFDTLATDPASWTAARRAAVDGGSVATSPLAGPDIGRTVCQTNWAGFSNAFQNPVNGFNVGSAGTPVAGLPIYDPVSNPGGVRGTVWDSNVNSFGRNGRTGFARSPYDNVGVQYGLAAVNAGKITPEEFVHLNEKIGGLDIDGNLTRERSAGDPIAVRRAYASGRVLTSFEDFRLPIIDVRVYVDNAANIHPRNKTLAFLERLKKANGTTENQVNWTTNDVTGSENLDLNALKAQNEWLDNIAADKSADSYAVKVIRNKPAHLKDACWVNGEKTEEPVSWDPDTSCNKAMPIDMDVRIVAGGPLSEDILMCKLKPIDFSAYQVTFTPSQRTRLAAAFPRGVCDWSVPGEGQSKPKTWIDFSTGDWGASNIYN